MTALNLWLKGHKEKFRTSYPCHLINPLESELGKKVISEKVNKKLALNVDQWNNSDSVIKSCDTIEIKSQYFFMQLDSVETQALVLMRQ